MASAYGFPTLEVQDIVSFFEGDFQELDVKENDFKSPQRDRWQKFYTVLLADIAGTNPDSINQCQFQMSNELEYAELHEEAIPLFNLAKAMQRVMFTCGLEDFRITDLIQPTPRRLIRICSALINFLRFQQERLQVYEKIKLENAEVIDHRNLLTKENEDLQKRINTVKASRAEKQPQILKLKEETASEQSKLEEHHRTSATLQKDMADMKTKLSEKNANAARLKEQVAGAKEDANRLSNQIVQSPDRMKTEKDKQSRHLNSLKQTHEDKLVRLIELRKQVELQIQREGETEQALRLVTAINEKLENEKKVLADTANIRENGTIKRDQIRDLDAKEQQLKRMLGNKQEKLEKHSMQHHHKKAELQEMHEQLVKEKEIILASKNEEELEKHKIEEKRRAMCETEKSEVKEHQDRLEGVKTKYSDLLQQLDAYHLDLGDSWRQFQGEQ